MNTYHRNNCVKCQKATALVETDAVLLTVPENALVNLQDVCFKICCTYESPSPTVPVLIDINGTKVPLWDRIGRPIFSNHVRTCTAYHGIYVDDTTEPHVTLLNVPLSRPCDCAM